MLNGAHQEKEWTISIKIKSNCICNKTIFVKFIIFKDFFRFQIELISIFHKAHTKFS